MRDINKQVGSRIREIRLTKGVSQDVLAARSGLHRAHMGQIERGESNVTVKTLYKIGTALGVQVPELVRGLERKARVF